MFGTSNRNKIAHIVSPSLTWPVFKPYPIEIESIEQLFPFSSTSCGDLPILEILFLCLSYHVSPKSGDGDRVPFRSPRECVAPYSLCSALLLNRAYRTLVKTSALCMEYSAIRDTSWMPLSSFIPYPAPATPYNRGLCETHPDSKPMNVSGLPRK
jgi:hypothetical protein